MPPKEKKPAAGTNNKKKKENVTTSTSSTTTTTTSSSKHKQQPKSVLDKIVAAIRALKDPGTKGSSRTSIQKYCQSELEYNNPTALKKAFQQGVQKGILVQTGQSFRVTADPVLAEATEDDGPTLRIEDVAVGTGEETAQHGDSVTVSYRGKLDSGYEFDKAAKFTFLLGAGDVIKGWDRGIEGMKKGGKRKLVVPPKLGYGKRGCKPDIPGNATLYFEVTLKEIEKR
ncbi:peptidyl-prolyl cis-trans isomerase [Nitzschia inconspicua]|uniref:peptidylprolyl isomerase n=1 Tax=Nitzschia inconspicua TaxID=303405 RepID=A0A9K3KLJ9_9STRA|nr:peptidyl-prolyl cis-trans isomerase [Nitzschia inconspicua]